MGNATRVAHPDFKFGERCSASLVGSTPAPSAIVIHKYLIISVNYIRVRCYPSFHPALFKRWIFAFGRRNVGGEQMHVRVEVGQVPEGLHEQDQPRAYADDGLQWRVSYAGLRRVVNL